MDLTINPETVASFKDKDSKNPKYRELYETRDFIGAYAEHTNLRVADNPKGAIGREDEWESHGKLQLDFLKDRGLKWVSRLLDVGCGVGRLARKVVPFLDKGHYIGVDISMAAIHHAQQLAETEGWKVKGPCFFLSGDLTELPFDFDFIWAHSVFTHLPPQQIEVMVANIAKLLVPGGSFYFTYKFAPAPRRSGLKQFQYPPTYFLDVAKRNGLIGAPLPDEWPAGQKTYGMRKPA